MANPRPKINPEQVRVDAWPHEQLVGYVGASSAVVVDGSWQSWLASYDFARQHRPSRQLRKEGAGYGLSNVTRSCFTGGVAVRV